MCARILTYALPWAALCHLPALEGEDWRALVWLSRLDRALSEHLAHIDQWVVIGPICRMDIQSIEDGYAAGENSLFEA